MTEKEWAAVRELSGDRCCCGRKKAKDQTFCRGCYFTLSAELQRALYRRIGHGYIEAYDASKAALREAGRLAPIAEQMPLEGS